jgi:hypothetical protein
MVWPMMVNVGQPSKALLDYCSTQLSVGRPKSLSYGLSYRGQVWTPVFVNGLCGSFSGQRGEWDERESAAFLQELAFDCGTRNPTGGQLAASTLCTIRTQVLVTQ